MKNERKAHDLTIGFLNYLLEKDRIKLDSDKAVPEIAEEYLDEYERLYSIFLNHLGN